jgi:polysaccharide pyruvyl transferase WcaK-like protein
VLLLEPAARSCDPSCLQVAFILRPPANGQWPVAAFARLADAVARQLNARVVFIPFHVREDVPFTRAVRDAMTMPAEIASWETGTDLFRTVSRSNFIISGRLHGVILAALNGVPFVGISEDPKIERFLKELGLHRIPDAGNIETATLLPLVLETWSGREEFCRDITSHLLPMRARVQRVSDLLFGSVCSGYGRPNKIE